ncbi:MAG: methionine aminotransferase [Algoriphagus sp.]|uniref:methionine aminotransferase n=1 Tax=Algoriphagus sp. TaxID=1872435 RepID=UPI00262250A8|nr:methionine aminotransferase [Algoriphagus sp.]MDG1276408.1 methionine aminotransferase [Algoriphagus sp.]
MLIESKLPEVGTTIFTIMSKLAADHHAINLSQGFPGFNAPQDLLDLVTTHMRLGNNQYAPMSGVPILRQRIAKKVQLQTGIQYNEEEEITVVSGATEAIFSAITATVRPGDEVIVLEPAYDLYVPVITLSGGVPVFVSLNMPDFSVDWEKLKSAVTKKTRLIMVNTPHNPGGYIWTQEDLDNLADLIKDKNILVISDEVYEHITFDGRPHLSLMAHPVLRERTFVCCSFGKTFHVTGWKVGYCLAPKELTAEFRKVHQFVTFSTPTPFQYALADFIQDPDTYLSLPKFYQKKRDLFCEGLETTDFTFTPAQGSFFQLVSYKHLSDEPDLVLAKRLTTDYGVACIPISVFFQDKTDHKILRFCFAKNDSDLFEALNRLLKDPIF